MLKRTKKIFTCLLLALIICFNTASCDLLSNLGIGGGDKCEDDSFYIVGSATFTVKIGEKHTLECYREENLDGDIAWSSSSGCASVENGIIIGISEGTAVIKATLGEFSDYVTVTVIAADDGTNNDDNSNEDNGNVDEDDFFGYVFGSEYDTITVSEALELAEPHTSGSSPDKYYVIAKVDEIKSASKGEMTISDDTGSIYVYKSTTHDGEKLSGSGLIVGDFLIIYGTLRNYRGLLEIDNGKVIAFYTPGEDILYGPGFGNLGDPVKDEEDEVDGGFDGGLDSLDPSDPYSGVNTKDFYENYKPATSPSDAYYRTQHGLMSGSIADQTQEPTISEYRPTYNGKYVRNDNYIYSEDGMTYYVVDAYGEIVLEIYKGGAYVVLEEVAAYVFAFGEPPANQDSSKNTEPENSIWGEYLRLNHTKFSGSTRKYPYEPELPNISGCGGDFIYYEMDIGTLGTDCDPNYPSAIYNNGTTITRGAARIVYSRYDSNDNGKLEPDEKYVFYTYNHYNDFQEYLNYYGGWGEMFGNITGGGKISSKTDYNPTKYVETARSPITAISYIEIVLDFAFIKREEV